MAKKIALLIGVGDYGSGLKPLQCPANGVAAMKTVLTHPEIGGFDEVIDLVNPDVGEMRRCISSTFAPLTKDDLALLYFSGHGIKDMTGAFYLTTAQSELFANNDLNTGTAVEAEFIKRVMNTSYAERKVVILDCCFAAAFAEGFVGMDDSSIDVEAQLGAAALGDKGYCVLTASTSTRYALEQTDEPLSVYTRYLVEGLKTGGAAPDGQAFISLRHWHEYVKAQVKVAAPAMEPAMFNAQQGYDIVIAKAVVDNEQRYRKQVQGKVRRGAIRPAARVYLSQWQQRLGLTAEQATAIEAEVLKPFRERQKHVEIYAGAVVEEKAEAFPLGDEAIQDLKDLQRLLNLRDEDIEAVELEILGAQIFVPRIEESVVIGDDKTQTETQIKQKYSTFSFETVRVNEQGTVVETIPGEAEYVTEALGNGVTLELVRIPGGKFLMGASKGEAGARDNEYPQHEVTVSEFWLGKYAVTQAQWKAVAALDKIERDLLPDPSAFKGERRPVEQVSWLEAVEFCKRLSQCTGQDYRLASEAQWEYACRAGTTTPFYFGQTMTSTLANYRGTVTYVAEPQGKYRQTTTEVGSFPPNGFGLYDMHGNVIEWCLDGWHDSYKNAQNDGSEWKSNNSNKLLRGGSWGAHPRNCSSATRGNNTPDVRHFYIGFRVSCLAPKAFP